MLDALAGEDPFDWRVSWYRGKLFLAAGDAKAAGHEFDKVYFEMPGEIAPKLAIAFAAEQAGEIEVATGFYQRVAKTDPNYTTAVFGLARCLQARNDYAGAANALDMVPPSHSLYTQSRIALARVLMHDEMGMNGAILDRAAQTIESISTEGGAPHQLAARLLYCAVSMVTEGKIKVDRTHVLLGNPVEPYDLRVGAESEYRKAARYAADPSEKVSLVDRANAIRPVTLF
jgi:serine/threonine-protein kinase PknG